MKPFRIVFMGTPQFAVPALKALHTSRHEIVAVLTQPDRPKGRGRRLTPPPVKVAALELGYPVEQPGCIHKPDCLSFLTAKAPDLFVVIAFGRLLKPHHFAIPPHGVINVHASLLPRYRGPAPIQWALINGDRETGVTTMVMEEELDAGDMLLQARTAISSDDTAATLHDRLSEIGAQLLLDTLDQLATGRLDSIPQDPTAVTYAPLLTKKDGRIRWDQPTAAIDAFIRGMTPWPGAFTFLGDLRLKLFKVRPARLPQPAVPGTIIPGFSDEIRVATGDGALTVLEIQSASGRRMAASDFLKGTAIIPGSQFE
jgi:methionyl-tRNA formyltransferase